MSALPHPERSDVREEALASGMQHAAGLFNKQVERRRLTAPAHPFSRW